MSKQDLPLKNILLDAEANYVDIDTCFLKEGKTVWMHPEWLDRYANSSDMHGDAAKEAFYKKYAFVMSACQNYPEKRLDQSVKKVLQAERYGGIGIGVNGGGARCLNHEDVQVKGVGRNCLSADKVPPAYSHGSLNFQEAVYEAIASVICNAFLPLGAGQVFGLIFTGENTSVIKNQENGELDEAPGALLVRETCIRPGHLLAAQNFSLSKEKKAFMREDDARLRFLYKEIARKGMGQNDFIASLGNFIAGCANQFSFAKLSGLIHGALTPSNLSIDGRWLDLTNVTFSPSCKNFMVGIDQISFYKEPQMIITIIIEALYTYSKYNGIFLDARPLVSYYQDQFKAYYAHYLPWKLGLNHGALACLEGEAEQFVKLYNKVIYNDKKVYAETPKYLMDNDTILCLVESLYLGMVLDVGAIDASATDMQRLLQMWMRVLQSAFEQSNTNNYLSFKVARFINAHKQASLISLLYRASITNHIDQNMQDKPTMLNAGELINGYSNTINLILNKTEDERVVLFENRDIEVYFKEDKAEFYLRRKVNNANDNERFGLFNIGELVSRIHELDDSLFYLNDILVKDNLKRMLEMILIIVDNEEGERCA